MIFVRVAFHGFRSWGEYDTAKSARASGKAVEELETYLKIELADRKRNWNLFSLASK